MKMVFTGLFKGDLMLSIQAMQTQLEASLPHKRYKHSLRVYETALEMIKAHGFEGDLAERTAVAALLHDCGRVVNSKGCEAKAKEIGVAYTALEANQPILFHAIFGVYYAQKDYGVTDPEILEAIRYHTTGTSGMSPMAKLVFLADMIEPARDFSGVEELRAMSFKDLDEAMLMAYKNTIGYLIESGLLIHPDCISGYNELLAAKLK